MLRSRHLVLIQAALKFWREEQSPHGTKAFSGYVDEVPLDGELPPKEIDDLSTWLKDCKLRYVLSNADGTELNSHRIFESVEAAQSANLVCQPVIAPTLISASDT